VALSALASVTGALHASDCVHPDLTTNLQASSPAQPFDLDVTVDALVSLPAFSTAVGRGYAMAASPDLGVVVTSDRAGTGSTMSVWALPEQPGLGQASASAGAARDVFGVDAVTGLALLRTLGLGPGGHAPLATLDAVLDVAGLAFTPSRARRGGPQEAPGPHP
jgi:hypothetical protein